MGIDRRNFLGIALAGSASLLPGRAKANPDGKSSSSNESFGVLVDTTLCIGCRKCEWACNDSNKLSDRSRLEYDDKSVLEKHRRPEANEFTVINKLDNPANENKPYYLKVQCMHCNQPACVSACLVGALTKTDKGPVVYDPHKCMGCRYCMVACPFQIPAYEYHDPFEPRVRKCTFCFERLMEGKRPACVEACPNEALTFGKRSELIEYARERIIRFPERYVNHIYGHKEAGGTTWMYLSAVNFRKTELPILGDRPAPELSEKIQHGIFKSFVPPLALFGLLGLAMITLRERGKNKGGRDEIS